MKKLYLFGILFLILIQNAFTEESSQTQEKEKTEMQFDISDIDFEDMIESLEEEKQQKEVDAGQIEDLEVKDETDGEKEEKEPEVLEKEEESELEVVEIEEEKPESKYPDVPEEGQDLLEPIEIFQFEQLFEAFGENTIPHIIVAYDEHNENQLDKVNIAINQIRSYLPYCEGVFRLYTWNCDWFNKAKDEFDFKDMFDKFQQCESGSKNLPRIVLKYYKKEANELTGRDELALKEWDSSTEEGKHFDGSLYQRLYPDYRQQINTMKKFNSWLKEGEKKIFAVIRGYSYDKNVKALSAEFIDKLEVGFHMGEDEEEIMEQFNVEEFPSYYIVRRKNGELKIKKYDGPNTFMDIKKFFYKYVKSKQEVLKPEYIQIDSQNYQHYIYLERKAFMLHLTDGEVQQTCWKKATTWYNQMFTFGEINCEDQKNEYICKRFFTYGGDKDAIDGTNKNGDVLLFMPGQGKEKRKGSVTVKQNAECSKFNLKDEFNNEYMSLLTDDTQGKEFLSDVLQQQSIGILYMSDLEDGKVPLWWQALTSNIDFQYKINLAHFSNPSYDFMSQFGLQYYSLPQMVIFGVKQDKDDDEVRVPPSDSESQGDIHAFFNAYKERHSYVDLERFIKKELKQYLKQPRLPFEDVRTHIVYNKNDLEEYCTGFADEDNICIIGLYDGSLEKAIEGAYYQRFYVTNELVPLEKIDHSVNFIWLNVDEHPWVLEFFDIDDEILPQLVGYKPSTYTGYRMKKPMRMETENMLKFIKKVCKQNKHLVKRNFDDTPLEQYMKDEEEETQQKIDL